MQNSMVYKAFEHLRLWQPTKRILPADQLMDQNSDQYPLFLFIYQTAKRLYQQLPARKNGDDPFLHPINNVLYLSKAKITDPITLSAGLLHDYIEEEVDFYQGKAALGQDKESISKMDLYESERFKILEDELLQFCLNNGIDGRPVIEIIKVLKLLTRHKRHFYYRSISCIYNCPDQELKERAINIKLADRLHNVESIECFDESARIYVCFKNLFILNNTKKYLKENYGPDYLAGFKYCPMEKLFNKCARDTYDAFLTICRICVNKGLYPVRTLLQLAFKKFELLNEGLWEITVVDHEQVHPIRLYQAVVRKYDARLHHEFEKYEEMKKDEEEYCANFFADYNFSHEQLEAILYYKDAFALKEVIAYLIYQPEYVISRFLCDELSVRGRIKG